MSAKKVFELERELQDLRVAYHEASETETASQLAKRSMEMRKIMDAINLVYTKDAKACPDCGADPIGMKRRPGLYEVGCSGTCVDVRAQGETPDEAISNWNDLTPKKKTK